MPTPEEMPHFEPASAQEVGVQTDQRTRWLIAFAVMVAAIMELVDTSAVNVSLPYIAGNLSSSVDEATWVLTSYLVANATILPLSGWLANYFGRRRLLMLSVSGFAVASILCGLAPSLPALILFRVLQGLAGGPLQPTSRAILLESFPRQERGHAMALWGVGIVIAPIVAPVLGGWLTTDHSWRWVFFINPPISLVGAFLVWKYVFDPPYIRRPATRIDYWGMGLLAIGISSLQVVFDKGQEDDWFGSRFIVTMTVIAVIGLVSFTIWELHSKNAVVHFQLLRYRTFATGTSLSMVLFFSLYGSIVLLPLFMQELLNFPAITAGVSEFPARDRHHGDDAHCRFSDQPALGYARAVDRWPDRFRNRGVHVFVSESECGSVEFRLAANGNGCGPIVHVRSAGDDHGRPHPATRDGLCHQSDCPGQKPRSRHRHLRVHRTCGAPRTVPPGAIGGFHGARSGPGFESLLLVERLPAIPRQSSIRGAWDCGFDLPGAAAICCSIELSRRLSPHGRLVAHCNPLCLDHEETAI